MFKRGNRYICMFLIYLVIVLIFYTNAVFADFFAGIRGSDNVPGFRKTYPDVTIINVSAFIPGETVSGSQIKLLSDPTRPFECSAGNATSPSVCQMTVPGDLPPGPHSYEVQLFHADLSEAAPKQILTIVADGQPPKIHSFSIARNGSNVSAAYQVSDSACASCPPDMCAGIARIDFLLNYEKVGEFIPGTSQCLLPANTTLLTITPTPGVITKNICIEVYDRLLQKSSECKEIVMDFSPPQLINASLWFNNKQLRYTKGEPQGNVVLQAFIAEESELNLSSIIADLSSLNSRAEFSNAYKNVDMSPTNNMLFSTKCSNVSKGLYNCTWSNILVLLNSASTPKITLYAIDTLGNVMNSTYDLPILFDNTRPVVTGMRSGIADDVGRYWIGKGNNTLYVDIAEAGSGFNDKKLFMDFGSFGKQQYAGDKTIITPNNCTEGWTCIYDFINVINPHVSGEILPVTVIAGSSDDANNPVEGATSTGFYYDNEAPQILSIQNSTICPTFPDSIEIKVNVSEKYSGSVKAEVSAPLLSTNVFPMSFDCEETARKGTWTCDIVIDNLVTLYVDGEINLTLFDRAGNHNTTTLRQEVCEAAPGTPPNVISVASCDVLPASGIDRQVSERIPFPIFLRPTLRPISTGAAIQQVRVTKCSSSLGTFSDEYILDEFNFDSPLVGTKVQLSPEALATSGSDTIEKMDISCGLELIVRAGTKVYQLPEIENMTCRDVLVHGTVFGGIDRSLNLTMEDITDQIKDKEDEISDYEDALDVLGGICTIAELMAKITAALQIIREVIWVVSLVLYALQFSKTAGEKLYHTTCRLIEKVSGWIVTLLWQIDSGRIGQDFWGEGAAWSSPGFYIKTLCGIFTCRLTEQNTFVEMLGGMSLDMDMAWGPANSQSYDRFVNDQAREGRTNHFPPGQEEAPGEIPTDVYRVIYSAYRSKEVATLGLCMPGYVYALRKERQLLCMKRNCYRDFVSSGFSPDVCEKMHSARHCTYVSSAAYKIAGDDVAQRITLGIVEYELNNAVGALASWGLRELGCAYPWGLNKYENIGDGVDTECMKEGASDGAVLPLPAPAGTLYSHICGLSLAVLIWMDVGDWLDASDWDWNYYNDRLGDPDYCSM